VELDLIAVGEVLLDVTLPELRVGSTIHAPIAVRAGGVAVNAAVAAARLGADASVVGRVGCDPAAAAIRRALELEGVDACLAADPAEPTGTFVASGRTIVADRGASGFLTASDVPSQLQARALLVSGHVLLRHETAGAARAAIDRSTASFVGVVVASARSAAALGWTRFRERTDGVTVVLANADEGRALTELEPHEAAAALAASYAIAFVTDAERGAFVAWDRQLVHRPSAALPSAAVGAGDAFAGAALHALALGAAPDDALERAVQAGELWARDTSRAARDSGGQFR
jgi:sugar/nucleoside kinase (ribokinase family)